MACGAILALRFTLWMVQRTHITADNWICYISTTYFPMSRSPSPPPTSPNYYSRDTVVSDEPYPVKIIDILCKVNTDILWARASPLTEKLCPMVTCCTRALPTSRKNSISMKYAARFRRWSFILTYFCYSYIVGIQPAVVVLASTVVPLTSMIPKCAPSFWHIIFPGKLSSSVFLHMERQPVVAVCCTIVPQHKYVTQVLVIAQTVDYHLF